MNLNRIIAFVIALVATYATLSVQISLGVGGTVQNTSLSDDNPTDGFFRSGIGFGVYLTGIYAVTPDISLIIQPGFDQRKTYLSYLETYVSEGELRDSVIYYTAAYFNNINISIGMRIYSSTRRWFFPTGAAFSLPSRATVKV